MKAVCQKLRSAIENEGRVTRIEGMWWQFSLTQRTAKEPSAVSLLKIVRGRNRALELTGRAWQEDGALSARYWSEAVKEREDASGILDGPDVRHRAELIAERLRHWKSIKSA